MTDRTSGESGSPDWGRRALWAGGLFAAVVVAVIAASATVPRWWAHRVGDQVDGSIAQGTTLGLVYGFVFTFLPIIAIVLILRWRRTWKTIVAALAIGILLALPNLMTLSIVVGSGSAAHAGDRVLDVEAPAFRGGSLVGAVVAVLVVSLIVYLAVSRRRAERNARRARSDLEKATTTPPDAPPES